MHVYTTSQLHTSVPLSSHVTFIIHWHHVTVECPSLSLSVQKLIRGTH